MKIKNHEYFTSKNVSEKTLAIASDIHLSETTNIKDTLELLDTLDRIKPTHILLPGDLYNVDSSFQIESSNIADEFIKFASRIAPIIYVRGNSELKSDFLPCSFSRNSQLHVLNSSNSLNVGTKYMASFGDMNIAGIDLPLDFYGLTEDEKVTLLLNKYQVYIRNIARLCQQSDFNILLCHDPIIIKIADELKALSNFDLVVSGHNHGGLVPDVLKPIFKLLGADLDKLYPTFRKGVVEKQNTKYLISEGVTKFHAEFGGLAKLERFHEGSIDVVRVLKKN
ncbi:MAG: hypothetical protein E7161_00715 [Firmicutes bacterium]|nr:hypothetical protein [Bacillota bacterium]